MSDPGPDAASDAGPAQRTSSRALAPEVLGNLETVCTGLIDWVSDAALPEERVGLREAAGNIGGLLISIMLDKKADFIHEEAANIAELATFFVDQAKDDGQRALLEAIRDGAQGALDSGSDMAVDFVSA